MNRHATLDELARLGADDLRSRKAARISDHLSTCAQCTELSDQLSSVPALLSSVQFPEMPESLAIMLGSTLAAEAAQRVAAEPATEAGRGDLPIRAVRGKTRRGLDRQRAVRSAWWLPVPATRVLATAAAIIVVGIGAYAVASRTGVSSSGPSSGSHAAASGPLTSQVSLGPPVTYRVGHSSRTIQTVTANTNVQPATLAGQAEVALSEAKMQGMGSSAASSNGNGISPSLGVVPTSTADTSALGSAVASSTDRRLAGCIGRVIRPGQVVLLVEHAKFEGKAATILVTAAASASGTSSPKKYEVWALGDTCSATSSDVLDHVKVARL
jgi:hypothetical protein